MTTVRIKEMVFGYNSVDCIINSFISTFNLELFDLQKLAEYDDGYHTEEQIAIIVKFQFPDAFSSMYTKELLNFVCNAECDGEAWYSDGITLKTAKCFFGDNCKLKNGYIYVNEEEN